jgi:hypothetical protein
MAVAQIVAEAIFQYLARPNSAFGGAYGSNKAIHGTSI